MMLILLGCAPNEAEPGSRVYLPDDLYVPWSEAFVEADDIGEVFPIDLLVLSPDGNPAAGVRVVVTAGWDGASLHAADADAAATRAVWDVGSGRARDLRASAPGRRANCTYLELVTGSDGRAMVDAFVDVAPDSGASVSFYAAAGDHVGSVEFGFIVDGVDNEAVVH